MTNHVERIQQILAQRVVSSDDLPSALRAYVEQSWGGFDREAVRQVLADPDHDEHDILLAFWGFPEKETVTAVEEVLPLAGLSAEEGAAVHHWFCARPQRTVGLGGTVMVQLTLPEDILEAYVRRLRLQSEIPTSLAEAGKHRLAPREALALQRFLRTVSAALSAEQIAVCRKAIEGVPSEDIVAALRLLLELWQQRDADVGLWALLVEEGQRCRQAIEHDQFQEKLLERQTMEQMMGVGNRVLAIDRRAYRDRLGLLDTLALQLYGAVLPAPQEPLQWNMGAFDADNADDVATLMRMLS
jgi:hypothetical protein